MAGEAPPEDMIDVIVRLPRATIEQSLPIALEKDSRATLVRSLLDGQRSRTGLLDGLRFADPLWEMILEIYLAALTDRQFKVLELCAISGSSVTTALRYLKTLEANGYTSRRVGTNDARSYAIVMQPRLRVAVDRWLEKFEASRTKGSI